MSKTADFDLHIEDYTDEIYQLMRRYFIAEEVSRGNSIREFRDGLRIALRAFWRESPRVPSITLKKLEEILYNETSVIAEDDVPLLMEVIRKRLDDR